MMDQNLNLLINSAILVICYAQEGAEERLAWGKFNELAPVILTKKVSLWNWGDDAGLSSESVGIWYGDLGYERGGPG